MAIRRHAYIIGAGNVSGETFLPGVGIDKQRMFSFLTSDEGGAWDDDEISVWEKPEFRVVDSRLLPQLDYQLFFFAGHGFTQNEKLFLCMNDRQDVAVDRLPIYAPKVLFIIDACRAVIRERPPMRVKIGSLAGVGALPDWTHRLLCRRLYDFAIERADAGLTWMFSTGYDQTAADSEYRGGIFTNNLIQSTFGWIHGGGYQGVRHPQVLTVRRAFERTVNRMGDEEQDPELYSEQMYWHLPFAVLP